MNMALTTRPEAAWEPGLLPAVDWQAGNGRSNIASRSGERGVRRRGRSSRPVGFVDQPCKRDASRGLLDFEFAADAY